MPSTARVTATSLLRVQVRGKATVLERFTRTLEAAPYVSKCSLRACQSATEFNQGEEVICVCQELNLFYRVWESASYESWILENALEERLKGQVK